MAESTGDKGFNGYAVIMAGGRGTRFWPLSRLKRPKQLLCLGSEVSLLRDTFLRVAPLVGEQRVLVITNREQADEVRAELPELSPEQVIAEPVGRNTAACSILGVMLASRLDPDAPVVILPADHYIPDAVIFRKQLELAFRLVSADGGVVTFGIPATRPETGYGYLECSADSPETPERIGRQFVEKPDRQAAQSYVESGRHFWNSGIFVWNARDFLKSARELLPDISGRMEKPVANHGTADFPLLLEAAYQDCPSVSIDVGIMEKLATFRVIPAEYRWSDLGSWDAWADLAPDLANGNRGVGDLLAVDSRDNVVHVGKGKTVALLGVHGLVIVDTGDAILIADKTRVQDIKLLISKLQSANKDELL